MKKILFSMLVASSLVTNADVRYGSIGLENGDIDVDGTTNLDVVDIQGKVVYSDQLLPNSTID